MAAEGDTSALTPNGSTVALIGAQHQGSVVTQIGAAATGPPAVQPSQLAATATATAATAAAASVLRCVSDLELAVSHLRTRDATTPTAATAATGKAAAAAEGHEDHSLGCGKGRGDVRHPSAADCGGSADAVATLPAAGVAPGGETATVAPSGSSGSSAGGPWDGTRGGGSVFAALARSVVYQQLATNAASAIWARVLSVCQAVRGDLLTPSQVLAAPGEQLRAAGLSGRKLEYLVGLAEAFAARAGWEERLAATSSLEHLVSELTPLRGVGTWTVHMLAMFHLGLADVLPSGDLGVRRGLQLLHGLSQLPTPNQVEALTEAWRPFRSVGSWYMWRLAQPPPKAAAASGGTKSSSSRKAASRKDEDKKEKKRRKAAAC
ncbi:hypothetical protein Vretifemale_15944 [Volvox reticuliferus]|uniref:HhH-GPD domain-containing protein n=1 Tax=Volvox reticuliferus TaxID=1737510 RepID=A0A8J4FT54_9CHLO|nr:hypothetical protein Vretifemale_15944 [Volvox reticuliferus]